MATDPNRGVLGGWLPRGESKMAYKAFMASAQREPDLQSLPQAVCFTVTELRIFLDTVEKAVNPQGEYPPEEVGVAIMPAYRDNAFTYMLVATRFIKDPKTGKTAYINNAALGARVGSDPEPDPDEPPVEDDAYDSGSSYP